jgi:hypothetical protein
VPVKVASSLALVVEGELGAVGSFEEQGGDGVGLHIEDDAVRGRYRKLRLRHRGVKHRDGPRLQDAEECREVVGGVIHDDASAVAGPVQEEARLGLVLDARAHVARALEQASGVEVSQFTPGDELRDPLGCGVLLKTHAAAGEHAARAPYQLRDARDLVGGAQQGLLAEDVPTRAHRELDLGQMQPRRRRYDGQVVVLGGCRQHLLAVRVERCGGKALCEGRPTPARRPGRPRWGRRRGPRGLAHCPPRRARARAPSCRPRGGRCVVNRSWPFPRKKRRR